jgi:phosphate-selective porin OprO/OprP
MKTIRYALVAFLVALGSAAIASAQTTPPEDPQERAEPMGVFQRAGILLFQTPDGRFQWWLDGRVNLDAAYYFNSDNQLSNGIELRRGRLAINMVLWKDWAGQFDVDFVDNVVDVKDAWIGYSGVRNTLVRAGNFRTPFGLETLTSSRYITFMERSLLDNFSPDRRIGLGASTWGARWQASAGLFGPELEDSVDTIGQSQTKNVIGRVTALPFAKNGNLLHLGVALARLEPGAATEDDLSDANRWRVRARPETHVNRGRFISTPQVKNVDHASLYGFEAAAVMGPVSLQGEYNREVLRRTDTTLPEPTYDGWYAFASWFPSGDRRPYDHQVGEFTRVVPKSSRGALELVARYSTMDLNDEAAAVRGGKADIVTVGANYYANANVRLMVNYLFVKTDEYSRGDRAYKPNDKFNVLQARIAMMF